MKWIDAKTEWLRPPPGTIPRRHLDQPDEPTTVEERRTSLVIDAPIDDGLFFDDDVTTRWSPDDPDPTIVDQPAFPELDEDEVQTVVVRWIGVAATFLASPSLVPVAAR